LSTLSLLLPVHNAQPTLALLVSDLLEHLGEIVSRFQLYILDDGSTDDTAEVARDLAALYPQIRVIRHPVRLGLAEAIQTGFDNTSGELILVSGDDYALEPDDLRTLWQLRAVQASRPGEAPPPRNTSIDKLLLARPWRSKAGRATSIQFIRRQAYEQLRQQQSMELIRRLDRGPDAKRPMFLGRVGNFSVDQ
jgi:glycosyltransferase involved in cell wall biosynthesis